MRIYIETLIVMPLLVLCYQLYAFSVGSEKLKLQERCLKLGVAFMTLGVLGLAIKTAPFAFSGLILMMFGFRLIAKGLDRLDKNVFIDRFDEDN
jgi:hypothetical protein